MGQNPIRVAIIGVGNCAASLVQGVHYYRDADASGAIPGLMHVEFGKYHVGDVQFVAAFDVDGKKVGHDLAEVAAERAGRLRVSFHVNNTVDEAHAAGALLRGHVAAVQLAAVPESIVFGLLGSR